MEHYTLIGHPLGHSMSPWIHERLFALAGREADYTLTDLVAEDLTLQIDDLRAMQGFNITIPHKMEIIPFLDDMAESAQRYQSVNCVVNRRGNLIRIVMAFCGLWNRFHWMEKSCCLAAAVSAE